MPVPLQAATLPVPCAADLQVSTAICADLKVGSATPSFWTLAGEDAGGQVRVVDHAAGADNANAVIPASGQFGPEVEIPVSATHASSHPCRGASISRRMLAASQAAAACRLRRPIGLVKGWPTRPAVRRLADQLTDAPRLINGPASFIEPVFQGLRLFSRRRPRAADLQNRSALPWLCFLASEHLDQHSRDCGCCLGQDSGQLAGQALPIYGALGKLASSASAFLASSSWGSSSSAARSSFSPSCRLPVRQ